MEKKSDQNYLFPIDLVYLWVDGNDPAWLEKRKNFSADGHADAGKDCSGRFIDNDELKFSLRSAAMYAPWINRIFIVTDNQVPTWLDTHHPKIKIVDHKEILPETALPTFNSRIIEHNLHKIPGLSDQFLYANDDMFFGRESHPSDFFMPDGSPVIRFNRRFLREFTLWWKEKVKGKKISNYNRAVRNTSLLVKEKFGTYIGHKTHHNIDAYCKSDFIECYNLFRKEIEDTFKNHIRSDNDLQRNLYSYVPFLKGRAKVRFVNQRESFRCHIDNPGNFIKLSKRNPLLFCLNDSEYAADEDRERMRAFLRNRFPQKSQFEK